MIPSFYPLSFGGMKSKKVRDISLGLFLLNCFFNLNVYTLNVETFYFNYNIFIL
jgi:hypothetical protein